MMFRYIITSYILSKRYCHLGEEYENKAGPEMYI